MSANGYLIDRLTRHQIFLQRLASGDFKKSLPILRKMARDINAAVSAADLTSFEIARIYALQIEISAITSAAGVSLFNQYIEGATEFAAYEAEFTQKLLQGAVTVELAGVSTAALMDRIISTPIQLTSGKKQINTTFAGLFDTFASGASREVVTTVQAGLSSGATTREIVGNVSAMVKSRTFAQAEAVIRTAANTVGAMARSELYAANADVIALEEWTSVLDGRTSFVCQGRDGKKYRVGEGPMPPAHYNCRSVRVPVVDDRFSILRTGATRASMDGPVSSQTTYNSWLNRQPKDFQYEVLGKERAKLFRGGMNVDRFTDPSGRTYTLAELRQMEDMTLQ